MLIERAARFSPATRVMVQRLVPFPAVGMYPPNPNGPPHGWPCIVSYMSHRRFLLAITLRYAYTDSASWLPVFHQLTSGAIDVFVLAVSSQCSFGQLFFCQLLVHVVGAPGFLVSLLCYRHFIYYFFSPFIVSWDSLSLLSSPRWGYWCLPRTPSLAAHL